MHHFQFKVCLIRSGFPMSDYLFSWWFFFYLMRRGRASGEETINDDFEFSA